MRPPPPMPVKDLNAINCVADVASDAASEPMKKIIRPAIRTAFRDHISDSRPYTSCKDVEVLVNASS